MRHTIAFDRDLVTRNNTDITVFDNFVQVKLHETNIVTARRGGNGLSITLHTGGWYTHTTKKRMNEVLQALGCPFAVHQINGLWYVVCDNVMVPFWEHYVCVVIK